MYSLQTSPSRVLQLLRGRLTKYLDISQSNTFMASQPISRSCKLSESMIIDRRNDSFRFFSLYILMMDRVYQLPSSGNVRGSPVWRMLISPLRAWKPHWKLNTFWWQLFPPKTYATRSGRPPSYRRRYYLPIDEGGEERSTCHLLSLWNGVGSIVTLCL